jgi:hypothetical protein
MEASPPFCLPVFCLFSLLPLAFEAFDFAAIEQVQASALTSGMVLAFSKASFATLMCSREVTRSLVFQP